MSKSLIEVSTGPDKPKHRLLLTGEEPVTIGRDSANSLTIRDKKLSHFHCVIEKAGNGYRIRDLRSANGTMVNGERIKDADLKAGDQITIGRIKITYVLDGGEAPTVTELEALAPPDPTRPATRKNKEKKRTPSPTESEPAATAADPTTAENPDDIAMEGADPVFTTDDHVRRGPTFDQSADLGGASDAASATEHLDQPAVDLSAPADELEDLIRAAVQHEQQLRRMLQTVMDPQSQAMDLALVNSRGQLVHAPANEDVRASVSAGRDGVLFLKALLQLCLRLRATDLHIEPKNEKFPVRLRVDGMMVPVMDMHETIGRRLLRLVKILCELDIAQTSKVQDGHFCTDVPGRRIDYRVSFTPAMHGQKLVVRVLDQANAPTHIKDLGLTSWMSSEISQMVRQDSGMVMMCGPTGSGKTTTLYALIRDIDVTLRNVITIEDPVEYQIDGVTQLPINESRGNSFSNLLRSVLRQDPDVILVGEVRDPETAKIAMQAAITGHLVFSTVHAQDSIGTIFRLLDLGVEPYLVASGLNLVLAQRLVRKLCPACKRPEKLSPGRAMRLGKYGVGNVTEVYLPVGCTKCLKTGYIGRCAVFELLNVNDKLRDVILASSQIQDMRKTIHDTLFTSLHETGYRLVARGLTAIEEVERVVGVGE